MLVWLVACRADLGDLQFRDGGVPGVGVVTWDAGLEGRARVEYAPRGGAFERTPPVDAADGRATVLGLRVATTYTFRLVVADDEGRERVSDPIEADVQPPPVTTPTFVVDSYRPALACEPGGFVLYNWLGNNESGVGIIDRTGRNVWAVEGLDFVQYTRPRLGRDGRSILWNTNHFDRVKDIATIERLAIDGTSRTTTRTVNGHHDFLELPDGTMSWIGYEFANLPRETLDTFPGGWGRFETAYDRIYEAPEGAAEGEEVVVFDHVEDWPEGVFFNDHPYCDTFLPGACELGHANSLAYVASEDRYTLGLRWLDAIVNLDRTGAVQWVMGGPAATIGAPEDAPIHGHFSDAWAGGMLVFDNHDQPNSAVRDDPTSDFSRLVRYDLPSGEKVWEEIGTSHEAILGDVRRIPIPGCENVLVAWSGSGVIQELTPSGVVVWEVGNAIGSAVGRVQYLSSMYDFADQAYPE